MRHLCVDCNKYCVEVAFKKEDRLPNCDCGGLICPYVVWFGEPLPEKKIRNSFLAASRSEVFFTIGTSAVVQPASSLPFEAKRAGAFVIEINFETTVISEFVDESILGKSGEILPRLMRRIIN